MRITSLKVENVRTHKRFTLEVLPEITLITGVNGSGKTSLIEAVYIALQGKSFKGSDDEILRFGSPWYRIDVGFEDDSLRVVRFDPNQQARKKQFEVDGKKSYRMAHNLKYPVVLFDPDELRLLSGSPTRRRQFIDRFISQFDPEYQLSLRRYERALKQRNTLLKNRASQDSLFVWDVALSQYGAYIIKARFNLIERLRPLLSKVYSQVSNSQDEVTIKYSHKSGLITEQGLLGELNRQAERDYMLGYTSVGPHRHDIEFYFNSKPASEVASRGEVRTIVLALKFLEVDVIEKESSKRPVILLDDVFSELDEPRQKALMNRFLSYQTIITSVSAPITDTPEIKL